MARDFRMKPGTPTFEQHINNFRTQMSSNQPLGKLWDDLSAGVRPLDELIIEFHNNRQAQQPTMAPQLPATALAPQPRRPTTSPDFGTLLGTMQQGGGWGGGATLFPTKGVLG